MGIKIWDVFKAINRWKFLIIAVTIASLLLSSLYLDKKQTYTAEIVIQYNDPGAVSGYNPLGGKLDVYEIIAPNVIKGALMDLNSSDNIEDIRRYITITPVIPADIEELKNSKIKAGEEFTYNPTQYSIKYTVGSDKDGRYARNILQAIMDNYEKLYIEKYLNTSTLPDFTQDLSADNYDYIEIADILQTKVSDAISFLDGKASSLPDFRSSKTGMSFSDLEKEYSLLKDIDLSALFSDIYAGKVTADQDQLIKKYEYKIEQLRLDQQKKEQEASSCLDLLKQYAQNERDSQENQDNNNNDKTDTSSIDDNQLSGKETTYDTVMNRYVDAKINSSDTSNRIQECQNIIDVFQEEKATADESQMEAVVKQDVETIKNKLITLSGYTDKTMADYRSSAGVTQISYLSSVNIISNLPYRLYMIISFVIGIGLGVILAIAIEVIKKIYPKKERN